MAQVLAFGGGVGGGGLIVEWRSLVTGEKNLLVIGGTRTQVFADIMAIATSALNHCAT